METDVESIMTETPCTTSFIKPGKCVFCSKKTFNVCKECRQNFCHAQCSLDGWRHHTGDECIKVAELIHFKGSDSRNTSVDIAQNASLTNSSNPVYVSDFNSPATEYKEFTNLARDYTTKANVTFEDAPPKIPIIEPVVDNNYDDNSVKEPAISKAKPYRGSGGTLQQGVPSEVVVTYVVSGNEVFFVAVKKPFGELYEKLANEDITSLSPLINFQKGDLAIAEYSDELCRVEIINRSPVGVLVYFIDYGNTEVCDAETLKTLPDSYQHIPPLAIPVKLYSETVAPEDMLPDDGLITITPLKIENDSTWLVAVGDQSNEFSSIMRELHSLSLSTAATQPTSPATHKPRVNVDFIITFGESKSEVYGVLRSNGELLVNVFNIPAPSTQLKTAPVVNKVYAKNFKGVWCRARVISLNPIKIYFIDYGNSEECRIDQLFEIPEELQNNPPPLAVKMVLEKESKEILEYGTFVSVSWDQENDTYLLVHDPTDKSAAMKEFPKELIPKLKGVISKKLRLMNVPGKIKRINEIAQRFILSQVDSAVPEEKLSKYLNEQTGLFVEWIKEIRKELKFLITSILYETSKSVEEAKLRFSIHQCAFNRCSSKLLIRKALDEVCDQDDLPKRKPENKKQDKTIDDTVQEDVKLLHSYLNFLAVGEYFLSDVKNKKIDIDKIRDKDLKKNLHFFTHYQTRHLIAHPSMKGKIPVLFSD